jgi:hypothetical protein
LIREVASGDLRSRAELVGEHREKEVYLESLFVLETVRVSSNHVLASLDGALSKLGIRKIIHPVSKDGFTPSASACWKLFFPFVEAV